MKLSEIMRERRKALRVQLDALVAEAETRSDKSMTPEETAKFDQVLAEVREADARILELESTESAEARTAAIRLEAGEVGEQRTGGAQVTDPPVYVKGGVTGHSYLQDLARRNLKGDSSATERLVRSSRAVADETRALGNTNGTGGSGGELAPPTWLVQEWIALLRPGRVTADLFNSRPIPEGTSSISIPRVTSGTSVAVQTTQNSTVASTDLTTGFISTGFTTILGKQVYSQQLLDQSAVAFDDVVSQDMAAAYNSFFGAQVILGPGTGANNNAQLNGLAAAPVLPANAAILAAAPTPAQFYSKANGMLASFVSTRYAQPEVWVMHPRRWYWLMAQTDSQGRPLVVPQDVAVNPMGAQNDGVNVAGSVGRFLGLPVVIDPNIPTDLTTGNTATTPPANQDEIFLLKVSDLWLFEDAPRAEVFTAPYAESMGVLFRLYNYAGLILNRFDSSIATMNGPGLAAPAF